MVVANNLLVRNASGGIWFSGTENNGPDATGTVPFGRIYNNTVFGLNQTGVGIQVDDDAAPTIMNNILANLEHGITVEESPGTVVAGSLYQDTINALTGAVEDFGAIIGPADPLFVDPSVDNYYLKAGTTESPNLAIDSSIGSLQDRFEFQIIKEPLGIGISPIIAPSTDLTCLLYTSDAADE